MASIIDAFNDAFSEEYSLVKILVYSLPVFASAYFYVNGNNSAAFILGIPALLIAFGLLACGINNILSNKKEILTANPFFLIVTIIKSVIALSPMVLILGVIGYFIVTRVSIPPVYAHAQEIFQGCMWVLLGSIVFTSFLSFARKLKIIDAYNLKIISESSIDILVCLLFLIPQISIADTLLVGFVWYIFFFFKIPATNLIFVFYCSMIAVLNISVVADYLAQVSYEYIKGKDDEYDEFYKIKGANNLFNPKKK
ncbi:MAG: hypothetical protein SPL73_01245 [Cyanobacteriota bacterium]|nr:hypothetical protein [Cyanobacteriota bacterium]MDY6358574.1 hypothetical protein [Cyanobacteriota bacterium]MDY6363497.1 hypothetical protein [Cyanobacteriota bacterium]MDY6383878.1 hypothetical protein [Cyanobacteriota bacterium]